MYVPKFTTDAVEDIKALPKNVKNALRRQIEDTLARDPIGASDALEEPLAGFRSYHFGRYRVVFRVFEDLKTLAIVGVGKKGPPARVYERLGKLATTGRLADKVLSTLRLFGRRERK